MATTNGDVHIETAASFAKDYLDDLFNNNKNLSAFEEETLDLNITSKYDNLSLEEEAETQHPGEGSAFVSATESIPEPAVEHASVPEAAPAETAFEEEANGETAVKSIAETAVESVVETAVETVVEHKESTVHKEDIPEPGHETLQVNGDVVAEKVVVAEQNGHLESEVVEPGHSHFSSESPEPAVVVEKVAQLNAHEEPAVLEPGLTSFSSTTVAVTEEEAAESEDVVTPIPMSRAKASKLSEDEELDQIAEDMNFKKVGLSKSWWDSKRTETEDTKEKAPPADKFKTIKQNIRKGNTRSLLERFENMTSH
ncbi:hypothetical protein TYRP_014502 [Tyrophagus putrescentiae]|nr:hypothetical protein TYRP_014502 [Tyrophagus putrescentiae]